MVKKTFTNATLVNDFHLLMHIFDQKSTKNCAEKLIYYLHLIFIRLCKLVFICNI